MPVRTNPLERGLTRNQKRAMAIIASAVVLVFAGLALWGSLASDSYSKSANGCVNITMASSTGGGILHYCGADARKFCRTYVTGSSELAQHARPQCRLAGLLPAASAAPVPSN